MPKSIYTPQIDHICLNPSCNNLTSNPKYCSPVCSCDHNRLKRTEKALANKKELIDQYNLNPNLCLHCNKPLPYDKRGNKYCDHKCSAPNSNKIHSDSSRLKQKISVLNHHNAIIIYDDNNNIIETIKNGACCNISWITCPITDKIYCSKNSNGRRRQCSPYAKDLKEIYYMLTRFKFNVYQIPEYFDLELLESTGWYSCPGKRRKKDAKNTLGISRDHLYSVSEGIKNKIHPLLLSHPANCRLVSHKENKSKHSKSSITIEQLVENILTFQCIEKISNHNKIVDLIKEDKIYVTDFEELRKLI